MTRPHIVRADTLDLQDRTSPTAQDHSHQPNHPAPLGIGPAAPHQEASLRRVDDERSAEEARMQNGTWADPSGLRDDPGSDDERTVVNDANGDNAAVRLNGGMSGEADDADMADADEDLDEMDRISSSPSISDGGCSLPCSPAQWHERESSLGPNSLPIASPVTSPSTACDSSSPFTQEPVHFPLSAADARRLFRAPAPGVEPISPSSYRFSPVPFSFRSPRKTQNSQSADHHRGEYAWTGTTGQTDADTGQQRNVSPRTQHLDRVEQRLQDMRLDSQLSLSSDLDDEKVQAMLEPVPSPLQNIPSDLFFDVPKRINTPPPVTKADEDSPRLANPVLPGSYVEEDDSWTTDSDADSWDEDRNKDDESNDVSFSDNPRFVDSGWGGECLQDAEDIDFEFVYALHTFVATVEGQANATKGDTMVLLDDSNSYWWLVRVVKDSSIGKRL